MASSSTSSSLKPSSSPASNPITSQSTTVKNNHDVSSKPTRDEKIEQLMAFQKAELNRLLREQDDINSKIEVLQRAIFDQSNLVSAARGLVAQRGHRIPDDSRSKPGRSTTRAKQRIWARRDGTLFRPSAGAASSASDPHQQVDLSIHGMVYTPFKKRFEAPRQSLTAHAADAAIICRKSLMDFSDLRQGDRLWIVFCLDRNDGVWRPFVKPPRLASGRVGLFATRSPNRPSPIGLSLCIVKSIRELTDESNDDGDGNEDDGGNVGGRDDNNNNNDDGDEDGEDEMIRIDVSGVDILDETPLLMLYKYNPVEHCFPDARAGWIDDEKSVQPLYYDSSDSETEKKDSKGNDREDAHDQVDVQYSEEAVVKMEFIDGRSVIDVDEMVRKSLSRLLRQRLSEKSNHGNNPPIGKGGEAVNEGFMPVGAFRVYYRLVIAQKMVLVTDVVSGMRRSVCEEEVDVDPEAALHLVFQDTFKSNPCG